jgi:glycosyltransferase involved in cell wall biosynthesis
MSGGTDFIPLDRTLVRKMDAMLACSYFNAWQLRARYRKRQPVVIYNGVDTRQFAPRAASAALRAQLGVATEATLFAFAGRLVGWKGIGVAVRALAEPAMRAVAAQLLIIGDGPERQTLRALADSLGVGARVLLHEPVAHARVPEYYGAIDVGVFPSIGDEAFGITIAEAMSCGKPVIGSHIGGIPEVIGNEGSAGLLVAPGDAAALAQAMRALALDPARRARMGAAARARIETEFSWTAAAQRLLQGLKL